MVLRNHFPCGISAHFADAIELLIQLLIQSFLDLFPAWALIVAKWSLLNVIQNTTASISLM